MTYDGNTDADTDFTSTIWRLCIDYHPLTVTAHLITRQTAHRRHRPTPHCRHQLIITNIASPRSSHHLTIRHHGIYPPFHVSVLTLVYRPSASLSSVCVLVLCRLCRLCRFSLVDSVDFVSLPSILCRFCCCAILQLRCRLGRLVARGSCSKVCESGYMSVCRG